MNTAKTAAQRFYIRFDGENVEYISPVAKCGEIWMCALPESNGSVQSGCRPVFIVSNDKNNQFSSTLNVIPLTTKMNKRNLPCHVEIWDYERYGLTAPSTMLVEQMMTISKTNLKRRLGNIDSMDILVRICKAMQVQFPVITII